MKRLCILSFLVLLTSCSFFASAEKKTSDLVNKELQEINWAEVDNYPLFYNCDETVSKALQRYCFEQELLAHCSKTLQNFNFEFDSLIKPEVIVDFVVDQDGKITDIEITKDDAIDVQMPNFEHIITEGLKNVPPLGPALKRGIPVKAKFRIPIELKSSE